MPAGVASFIQRDGHIGANWNSPPAHSIPLRSTDLFIRCNNRRAIGTGTRKRRENFLFSVKGARFITHMKKLREVEVPLANFFASGVLALEEKLGPILWQFPPNFGWNEKRFREFFQLLPKTAKEAALLGRRHDSKLKTRAWLKVKCDRALRYCVEIRHVSFLVPDVFELLREFNIA
ncbi:MAG TPA: DUF72 domain-containing protein, partial [Candidatus Baltobacteraceae bacterium]|nr:DUF72 domain-containing protein [Candidatus Baltobacteraceae bacterium]